MKRILAIVLCLIIAVSCVACSNPIYFEVNKMSAEDELRLKKEIIGRWVNYDKSLIIIFDDPSAKEYTVPGYYATFISVNTRNKKDVRVSEITNFSYQIEKNTLILTSIDEETRGNIEIYTLCLDASAQTLALTNDRGITTFLSKQ